MIKNSISLVINTKNEEDNIQKCIKSAKGLADEIIVVDMKSSDKTVQLAKKSGAKVFTYKKDFDYVEPARKMAISKASCKWILILDADERISKTLNREIKKVVKISKYKVFGIPRNNIIFGKQMTGDNYWPDYQVRLFKKGSVSWSSNIHSGGTTKEEIFYLPKKEKYAINHLMKLDSDKLFSKTDRYSSADSSFKNYINNKEFSSKNIINYLNHELQSRYVKNKGHENGFGGFILYKLMEAYRFAEITKYWLKNNRPDLKNEDEFISHHLELAEFQSSKIYKIWKKWKKLKRFLSFDNNGF